MGNTAPDFFSPDSKKKVGGDTRKLERERFHFQTDINIMESNHSWIFSMDHRRSEGKTLLNVK